MPFVVDASVTMAWCFDDEATEGSEATLQVLQQEHAIVPSLWQLEVTNVLLSAERRGRITESQAVHVLDLLTRLPIRVDDSVTDPAAVLATGRLHGLSAYDAAYLVLAERRGLALATLDAKLRAAAKVAGVPLLPA